MACCQRWIILIRKVANWEEKESQRVHENTIVSGFGSGQIQGQMNIAGRAEYS